MSAPLAIFIFLVASLFVIRFILFRAKKVPGIPPVEVEDDEEPEPEPMVKYKGAMRSHDFLIRSGRHDKMDKCPVCEEEEEREAWPTGRKKALFGKWFIRDI